MPALPRWVGMLQCSKAWPLLLIACTQTVVLKVDMMCEGCVGAVKRVLGKLEGTSVGSVLTTATQTVQMHNPSTLHTARQIASVSADHI